jgi:hypothetical protein
MDLLTLIATCYDRSRGYVQHGPRYFFMAIFARFMVLRSFVVWLHRERAPKLASSSGPTMIESLDVEDAVLKIRQDGVCPGLRLRRQALEELLSFCSSAPFAGDGNPDLVFRYGDKRAAEQQTAISCRVGKYVDALPSSPQLRALAFDPQLLAIARRYLGTKPVLVGANIWWSFPGPADGEQQRQAGQAFHYDIDGYGALTFFFYLTDVGPSNGPHVYVRGTHVKKLWRHTISVFKRRSDAEMDKCYGPEQQVLLCGPAGYGFAEDIFGFHKGLHPESGDRLIVQIRYALHDYVMHGKLHDLETERPQPLLEGCESQ